MSEAPAVDVLLRPAEVARPLGVSEAQAVDPILRPKEVARRLGVSRATVYTLVKRHLLPPPIKIGVRASGWRASTINLFVLSREIV